MGSDSILVGPVDEEERWLDALEKGELDDNGELKKEVDESLLTARQVRTSSLSPNFVRFNFPFSLFCLVFVVSESPATQAAEPAAAGAPHGLQGEGDDGRDDAEARGASQEATAAGRQEGGGQQEPDDREADQNQQGQDQKHEGEEGQAESVSYDPLQRLRPGRGRLLPRRSCHPADRGRPLSSCSTGRLRSRRLHQPEEVLLLKDRRPSLQPRLLQEEPAARSERSLNCDSSSGFLRRSL